MSSPRVELAAALELEAPLNATVYAQEPATPPAPPALIVRPGTPYRSRTPADRVVPARELWRLEVAALVAVNAAEPLDALDELVDAVVRTVDALAGARYLGVQAPPAELTVGGTPYRAAIALLEVTRY